MKDIIGNQTENSSRDGNDKKNQMKILELERTTFKGKNVGCTYCHKQILANEDMNEPEDRLIESTQAKMHR